MQFKGFSHKITGVTIPVSILRGKKSFGIGDFADLREFADWCSSVGIELIQLLPVNDTGGDSSPYSALSAYALHPVYMAIEELPEFAAMDDAYKAAYKKSRTKLEKKERISYHQINSAKLDELEKIYTANRNTLDIDGLKKWQADNNWVCSYALFRAIKEKQEHKHWKEWSAHTEPSFDWIENQCHKSEYSERIIFFAWIQWRLSQQFAKTSAYIDKKGLILKGDIPILMNEDSVDVWLHRDIFDLDKRAGAPPDMFSYVGQNWGFPVYRWDELKKQDYAWWRHRLREADKYYHAYRIDHVLGFFRIWTIDAREKSGILGYYNPSDLITVDDLYGMGFDDGRIQWMSKPHINEHEINEAFGDASAEIKDKAFDRINSEPLFLFKSHINGEGDIDTLDIEGGFKSRLFEFWHNRALIQIDEDHFAPVWFFRNSRAYGSLTEGEKTAFENLVSRKSWKSEQIWEENAKNLLGFMKSTVPMLTCAEDLGVIPKCVPSTLESLDILSLKIPRWARKYDLPEQPFIPHVEYPALSVCAASVHDTSTLRGWWEKEEGKCELWAAFGGADGCPDEYTPEIAQQLFDILSNTRSRVLTFQLQDFFDLDSDLRSEDPDTDRINIPGSCNDVNWSYRMNIKIKDLQKQSGLNDTISKLTEKRRKLKYE